MKLLLTAIAALAIANPTNADNVRIAPATFKPVPKSCDTLSMAEAPNRTEFRKLTELPPAEAYQAVYRLDEKGCPDPMLVSERINGRRR